MGVAAIAGCTETEPEVRVMYFRDADHYAGTLGYGEPGKPFEDIKAFWRLGGKSGRAKLDHVPRMIHYAPALEKLVIVKAHAVSVVDPDTGRIEPIWHKGVARGGRGEPVLQLFVESRDIPAHKCRGRSIIGPTGVRAAVSYAADVLDYN